MANIYDLLLRLVLLLGFIASGKVNALSPQDFVGTWINDDENTGGITRIIIDTEDGTMSVPNGKCHPTDCDWGIVPYTGNPFEVFYEYGFATATPPIRLVSENALYIHNARISHYGTHRDPEAGYYKHRHSESLDTEDMHSESSDTTDLDTEDMHSESSDTTEPDTTEYSKEYGWGKRPEEFGLQEGQEIETFGPHTFSLDSQGNMYVVDTINGKIKFLNKKGEYQRNIDFAGWASDIVAGRNKELFILDSDSIAMYSSSGKMTRHKLSTEIPQVEGYGQGMRFDEASNLYLCQFQQCYQIGVAQSGTVVKILSPQEQMENISPGFPIKGNQWVRTVWQNNHEAVIEIMDNDWAIVQTIPMKTDDVFGMVGFLRQDDKGLLCIEVERITRDNYVHLEVWQYDKTGQQVSVTELPNDYYSTVYKKVVIDSTGKIRQVITTPTGVKSVTWKAAYIQISGQVTNSRNQALAGIKVKVPLVKGTGEVFSGPDGTYHLYLSEKQVPSSFAVLAYGKHFLPVSKNVTKSKLRDYVVNFTMENISSNIRLLEIEPTIHHLGDNNYRGAVNSQFQQRTEGNIYTKTFKVDDSYLSFLKAEVVLFAKGLQRANTLSINGTRIGTLNSSPSDGSFVNISLAFNTRLLKKGDNTLEISSALESSDFDDFEFTNITIRFKLR